MQVHKTNIVYTYVLPLQPYCDITSVLICSLIMIIVDILLLFQQYSYVIKEMPGNWHFINVLHMHLHIAALQRPITVI